jgi:hypothetical protein
VGYKRTALPQSELLALGLTPEEGFVLSRLDVELTPSELVAETGLPHERVCAILTHLAEKGAASSDAPVEPAAAQETGETVQVHPTDELIELGPVDPTEQMEAAAEAPSEEDRAITDEEGSAAAKEPSYRQLYESTYRGLERDARIGIARNAKDAHLIALAFDPDSGVLRAVLENHESGLVHARIAARHHGSSAGLELIVQRAALANDPQVQRALLRNPQVTEMLTKRLLTGRRMIDAYKITVDTDVPERTRGYARGVLRGKWATAQGEERAGLVAATEGRVLPALSGLSLDGRATSILCARSYTSILFVQNLARFGACPPALLAHLLKQPVVRRQQQLKAMILRHPNMPADVKRKL